MTVEEYAYSLYDTCVSTQSTSHVTALLKATLDAELRSVNATGSLSVMIAGAGNGKSLSREVEFSIAETKEACQKALRLYAGNGIDEQEVSSTLPDFRYLKR